MTSKNDASSLYRDASRAVFLGLAINLALGLTKLIGGLISGAFALISDAVNSLGDTLTSVVVLAALRISQRPADKEHPYGHSRAEAIAGSNVALVVILSALVVAWEAVRRMGIPHPAPPVWTLWIAGGNVVIKESLYRYKVRVGRRTGSMAVVANAWDHRSDALCALAVLIGLSIVRWAGPRFFWVDEAAALVVAGAIIWSGSVLFRRSASELMDLQADEDLLRRIREAAESVDGVLGVEKLWVRKTGLEYLADIHIEVDPRVTVSQGHQVGHDVKDLLVARFASLRDVLVHLEPYPGPEQPADQNCCSQRNVERRRSEKPNLERGDVERREAGTRNLERLAHGVESDRAKARRGERSLRILVADDNLVNQVLVTRILEKEGHRVTVAEDGQEVLDTFSRAPFDLVLMDLQMPRLDGLAAAAAIRAKEAGASGRTPIIALTAQASEEDGRRCREAGMDGHISKPIDARELLEVVDRLGGGGPAAFKTGSADPAVFDCDAALVGVAGDAELLRELVSVFLDDCPLLLADVKSALDRRDAGAFADSTVRLQDALSCLCASRAAAALRYLAETMEDDAARAAGYGSLAGELVELTRQLRRVCGVEHGGDAAPASRRPRPMASS